jgi:hypothetical protein
MLTPSIPKFEHPEEIYEAIIREHRGNSLRMGEVLMACGWTMVDAARAVVSWDCRTIAAAIANERSKRKVRLTSLSEDEVAELKKQVQAEKKATAQLKPKRTPRIGLRPPHPPHGSQS